MSVAKEVNVLNQTYFCFTLMDKLERSVIRWAYAGCPDYTQTLIKNDIVRLRRELNRLTEEVEVQ